MRTLQAHGFTLRIEATDAFIRQTRVLPAVERDSRVTHIDMHDALEEQVLESGAGEHQIERKALRATFEGERPRWAAGRA